MAKQIEILIPQPCHEDWNEMTIEAKGRHCNSCKKTVIDFTLMSDEQLVGFFKKKPANVCGRFTAEQLNKEMLMPAKKIPWLTYFFQISIPLFLLSLKSTAQHVIQKSSIQITLLQKDTLPEKEKPEVFRTIKGEVNDLQGNPISFASITIPGTQRGAATDVAGKFSIRLSNKEGFIKVSCVGYETQILTLSVNEADSIIYLKLTRSIQGLTSVVAGGIIVRSSKKSKKKKEVASVVCTKANSILTYPNPISPNSTLTIKWNYPVSEEQLVEIYNMSGELTQKENAIVNKYTNTTTIQLLLKNIGNYVVKTTDRKTNKVLTSQLLVN